MFASIILLGCVSAAHAQEEYGKIRALQQRAAYVTKLKNDFVARVLTSYAIPNERNAQGAVTRLHVDGHWLDVTAVDIVPVLKETPDKRQQVIAHELLFYTADGTLDLVSDLVVR